MALLESGNENVNRFARPNTYLLAFRLRKHTPIVAYKKRNTQQTTPDHVVFRLATN